MGDRAVVRARPLVTAALALGTLALAVAAAPVPAPDPRPALTADGPASDAAGAKPAQAPPAAAAPTSSASSSSRAAKPPEIPIEVRPYRIRAWVAVDPAARLDARGRETAIAAWKVLNDRFVGPPWQVEVADGEGPLLSGRLEDLTPEVVTPLAQGFDKAWIIQARPLPGGYGLTLVGREYDAATGQIGLVNTQTIRSIDDLPRALFGLALDMFTPTAEIGKKVGGDVMVKVQGSMLPAANPVGRIVKVGSVFKVTRVYYRPDGSVAKILPVQRTYLRVAALEGNQARCNIITKLRDPLTNMIVGKYKVVAVGIKPTGVPTRLRFVTAPPENRPAAGYTLTSRPAPDGTPRTVAITDREGRVVLPPYFAENLVILRLLAANVEPLDEIPLMPGEVAEERTYIIQPKVDTVTLESALFALRDELVDQVAVRGRLEALLKPRAEAENWDEVRLLLQEYDKLTKRAVYEQRLTTLKEAATKKQTETKKAILTRTASSLLNETQALVERYIDDDAFASYADAYDRYAATAAPDKARQKTLPQNQTDQQALSGVVTPSAAGAGQEEARAGLAEFVPQGQGFRIAMPQGPVVETGSTLVGEDEIPTWTLVSRDPKLGTFKVTTLDLKRAVSGEGATKQALDRGRMLAAAAAKGAKVVTERDLDLEGHPGREVELEFRPTEDAVKHLSRVRTYAVGKRLYILDATGTEAQIRARAAELFLDSFRLQGEPAATAAKP